MQSSNRQGGSVSTFLIVGAVLTLISLGVLFFVRQNSASQRIAPVSVEDITQNLKKGEDVAKKDEDSTKKESEDKKQDDAKPEKSDADKSKELEKSNDKDTDKNRSSAEKRQDKDDKPASTKRESGVDEDSQTLGAPAPSSSSDSGESVATTAGGNEPLPATGPTQDVFSAVALGSLVGSAIAFVRSRRVI